MARCQNSAKPERGIETDVSSLPMDDCNGQNSAKPERGIETFDIVLGPMADTKSEQR